MSISPCCPRAAAYSHHKTAAVATNSQFINPISEVTRESHLSSFFLAALAFCFTLNTHLFQPIKEIPTQLANRTAFNQTIYQPFSKNKKKEDSTHFFNKPPAHILQHQFSFSFFKSTRPSPGNPNLSTSLVPTTI